jgi:toxin CcdB
MIRQFDAFPNPLRSGRDDRPYVVSIQHRSLDHLRTRLVLPLVREKALTPAGRLNAAVRVRGRVLHVSPYEITTLAARSLAAPVANLEEYRSQIIAALDLVFTGI